MIMESAIIIVLSAIVLGTAVVTDLRSSRIPNWLTLPAMTIALGAHMWTNGIAGLFFSLTGLGAGFALFLIMHLAGHIGAGDVKLMAAVGALMGPYGALLSGILAMAVGGGYALGAMCYQWGFSNTIRKLIAAAQGSFLTRAKTSVQELALPFRLRYALAIACGTLLFLAGLHPFGR
jgi:prepilin peptidase CpaA